VVQEEIPMGLLMLTVKFRLFFHVFPLLHVVTIDVLHRRGITFTDLIKLRDVLNLEFFTGIHHFLLLLRLEGGKVILYIVNLVENLPSLVGPKVIVGLFVPINRLKEIVSGLVKRTF
jgi:hypothetical protein